MKTTRTLIIVVLILSLLFGVRAAAGAQSMTITDARPNPVQAGYFTITLTGTGFTPTCVAEIEESSFLLSTTTTYVSSTQLKVSGNALSGYGTAAGQADVRNTATNQTSNVVYFTFYRPYPLPINFNIYPDNAQVGSGSVSFTATNYDQAPAQLYWTGNGVSSYYLYGFVKSASTVQFYVPANLLTTPGIAIISAPGYISVPFYITGNAKITSISPNTASAGDPDFTLTINGTGFVFADQAQWNGTPLLTMFVSPTQLQALVPASLVSATGYANVTAGYAYPASFSISTVHVSGKLDLEGETQPAQNVTLEFRPSYGAALTFSTRLAADGSFDARGVAPGAYTLAAKGYKWLRNVKALNVGQTPLTGVRIALLGGDANGDNSVDSTDFGLFIGAYGGDASIPGSGYDIRADFNDDSSVDSTDFGLFIGDFGAAGAP